MEYSTGKLNDDEILVAIDFSIKSPGIAIYQNNNKTFLISPSEHVKTNYTFESKNYVVSFIPNNFIKKNKINVKKDYFKRLKHNAEFTFNVLNSVLSTLKYNKIHFYIEGFSYGGSGKTHDIAECTGIFKYLILKHYNCFCEDVPPTVIKKFGTGHGNAPKDDVVSAFIDDKNNKEIIAIFRKIIKKMNTGSKKDIIYKSPFNDIVDALFLLHYIQKDKYN